MFGLNKALQEKVEKSSLKFHKIMKSSLKIKNEPIVIISDYGKEKRQVPAMLGYGYYHAAKAKGISTNILFQEIKKGFMHTENHIVQALNKLPEKSIIVLAVSNKLGRMGEEKSFRTFCKQRQHRFISATGLESLNTAHFDLLLEAMNINYTRLKKKGLKIKKIWDAAKTIRVTTKAGTDLEFDVEGMEAVANIGEYGEHGHGGNMPAGEVYIPPKGYYGVNGKVVIDGTLKTDDGAFLVDEPVTLIIEEGRVVKIFGKYAPLLEKTLVKYENRAKYPYRVRHIGELGIGINPGAVLLGSTIIDEKVLGTAHIALGSNYWFGGEIRTIFHGDQVFKNPVFYVDGKKIKF